MERSFLDTVAFWVEFYWFAFQPGRAQRTTSWRPCWRAGTRPSSRPTWVPHGLRPQRSRAREPFLSCQSTVQFISSSLLLLFFKDYIRFPSHQTSPQRNRVASQRHHETGDQYPGAAWDVYGHGHVCGDTGTTADPFPSLGRRAGIPDTPWLAPVFLGKPLVRMQPQNSKVNCTVIVT